MAAVRPSNSAHDDQGREDERRPGGSEGYDAGEAEQVYACTYNHVSCAAERLHSFVVVGSDCYRDLREFSRARGGEGGGIQVVFAPRREMSCLIIIMTNESRLNEADTISHHHMSVGLRLLHGKHALLFASPAVTPSSPTAPAMLTAATSPLQ